MFPEHTHNKARSLTRLIAFTGRVLNKKAKRENEKDFLFKEGAQWCSECVQNLFRIVQTSSESVRIVQNWARF